MQKLKLKNLRNREGASRNNFNPPEFSLNNNIPLKLKTYTISQKKIKKSYFRPNHKNFNSRTSC